MRFAAFDPGLTGAGIIYDRPNGQPSLDDWVVDIFDLPTHGEDSSRRINAPAIVSWLRVHRPDWAVIEAVTAMPSIPGPNGVRRPMGVASISRFFRALGAIEAAVACSGVPYQYVTPQSWKHHHRLKGSNKEASRQRAIEMVPAAAHLLARKKDHGRAEALLMAIWLADQYQLQRARGDARPLPRQAVEIAQ